MPNFGALIRPNIKEKLVSGQIGQKQAEKDIRILRVYNFHSRIFVSIQDKIVKRRNL